VYVYMFINECRCVLDMLDKSAALRHFPLLLSALFGSFSCGGLDLLIPKTLGAAARYLVS
jgi:hypothetical protein